MASWFDRFLNPVPPAGAMLTWYEDRFTATLPSAVDGGHFQATFTARWLGPAEPGASPVRRDWVQPRAIRTAEQATARISAARLESAQAGANTQLESLRVPLEWNVQSFTVTVLLAATPEAQRLATEWESLQTQLAVQRLKGRLELEHLRHLREDIFSKPEVARTYWLDRHPDAIDAVTDPKFEQLAETLGSGTGPGPSTMAVATVVQQFLGGLDTGDKKTLVDMLNHLLIDFRREELAARLPRDLT